MYAHLLQLLVTRPVTHTDCQFENTAEFFTKTRIHSLAEWHLYARTRSTIWQRCGRLLLVDRRWRWHQSPRAMTMLRLTLHCNSNYLCRPTSYALHAAFYDGVHVRAMAPLNCSSTLSTVERNREKNWNVPKKWGVEGSSSKNATNGDSSRVLQQNSEIALVSCLEKVYFNKKIGFHRTAKPKNVSSERKTRSEVWFQWNAQWQIRTLNFKQKEENNVAKIHFYSFEQTERRISQVKIFSFSFCHGKFGCTWLSFSNWKFSKFCSFCSDEESTIIGAKNEEKTE